ncbi:hypothetical protein [Pseudoalteromonas fuliginea]
MSDKPKAAQSSDEKLKIAKLEAQLKRVTEERDILKNERTHQRKICCGRTPLETLTDRETVWAEKI